MERGERTRAARRHRLTAGLSGLVFEPPDELAVHFEPYWPSTSSRSSMLTFPSPSAMSAHAAWAVAVIMAKPTPAERRLRIIIVARWALGGCQMTGVVD